MPCPFANARGTRNEAIYLVLFCRALNMSVYGSDQAGLRRRHVMSRPRRTNAYERECEMREDARNSATRERSTSCRDRERGGACSMKAVCGGSSACRQRAVQRSSVAFFQRHLRYCCLRILRVCGKSAPATRRCPLRCRERVIYVIRCLHEAGAVRLSASLTVFYASARHMSFAIICESRRQHKMPDAIYASSRGVLLAQSACVCGAMARREGIQAGRDMRGGSASGACQRRMGRACHCYAATCRLQRLRRVKTVYSRPSSSFPRCNAA